MSNMSQSPEGQTLSTEDLLSALNAGGKGGLDLAELNSRFGLDQGDLKAHLQALEAEGECIEHRGRWATIAHSGLAAGLVKKLRRGDALLLTEPRGDGIFFLRRDDLAGARDEDLVAVRPLPQRSRGRSRRPGELPPARVVKVLSRGHQRVVGTVRETGRWIRIQPLDPRLQMTVWVAASDFGSSPAIDSVVVVEPQDRAFRDGVVGRLERMIGDISDPSLDAETVIEQHGLPHRFPSAVLAELGDVPSDPQSSDWRGRKDLRHLPTLTIDGADAKDFDDAISIEADSSSAKKSEPIRLWVHIADVAHYVGEGSATDGEARLRGTSVYLGNRVVPMLPEALSNGLCSLRPDVPRLTVSVRLDIDAEGKIQNRFLTESVIESDRRTTYDEVDRFLRGEAVDGINGTALEGLVDQAATLLDRLLAARTQRGSIDLEIEETRVETDEHGIPLAVRPLRRTRARRMIEEFMLAANEAVATELETAEVAAVHRHHPEPSAAAAGELGAALKSLGLEAPQGLQRLHAGGLQNLLIQAKELGIEGVTSRWILRTLQRALYSPESAGHFALALRHYAHFTSPIRRYPDLVVHRALKAYLSGTELDLNESEYAEIAAHSSATERRAEQAERELMLVKKLRMLSEREGDRCPGTIVGVGKVGLFVEVGELLVDGVVPRVAFTDDRYHFEAEKHRWVGQRRGRTLALGDRVEVEITKVDIAARRLDLALVDMPARAARDKKNWRQGHSRPRRRR